MAEGSDKQPVSAGIKLRVAASSSRDELHPGWAWGLTAVVVFAGSVTLYAARGPIGSALDRWLPRLERTAAEVPAEAPAVLPAPEPPPSEPEWTYVDVETAIRPLPERLDILIAEGRDELSQFKDLGSKNETRALVIGNRWRLWGQVWNNRVGQIRRPMPPADACDVHAALEPTCRAVRDSLTLLDQVPAATNVSAARELLDGAAAILEGLREPAAEEEGGEG